MTQSINFLPLTAPVSPPFVPSSIDILRKEYMSQATNSENAIFDPIAAAFTNEKQRTLSNVSALGLTEEPVPETLHTRANSTTSNASSA